MYTPGLYENIVENIVKIFVVVYGDGRSVLKVYINL